MTEKLVLVLGRCADCQGETLLASTTGECPCLVCADCALAYLDTQVCGVCGTVLTR